MLLLLPSASSLPPRSAELDDLKQYASPFIPITSTSDTDAELRKKTGLHKLLHSAPMTHRRCKALYAGKNANAQQSDMPPRGESLTPEQRLNFTLGGSAEWADSYVHGDFHNSASKHRSGFTTQQFLSETLSKLIANCLPLQDKCKFLKEVPADHTAKFACPFGYPSGGGHLVCEAATTYASQIQGKRGFVVGSQWPWVEAILFAAGARDLTTIEYANATTDHPNYRIRHPNDVKEEFLHGGFRRESSLYDFGFSFSSLEHDGLGRYGDPLNPVGDLEAVAQAACLLKPGGLFFLGVPTMDDHVVWNEGRVYGHRRLALLFAPFTLVAALGFQPNVDKKLPLAQHGKERQGGNMCKPRWACNTHPIFVLRRETTAE